MFGFCKSFGSFVVWSFAGSGETQRPRSRGDANWRALAGARSAARFPTA
jgi:hypothetical protein